MLKSEETINAQIIPLNEILYDETFNCRGTVKPIDVIDLAKDIQEKGLIQPVTVTPLKDNPTFKYRLIAGFRRYVAHQVAKKDRIKCIINEDLMNEERATAFNLAENIQRSELDIMQEAKAVARIAAFGKNRQEIAKDLGMSDGWVQIRQMIMDLPQEIQDLAKVNVIKQTEIRTLHHVMRHAGADKALERAKQLKVAKDTGKKITLAKVTNTKRHRNKSEVIDQLDYMQSLKIPNGLWSRCLAWAAGNIDDDELEDSVKEHCGTIGIDFKSYADYKRGVNEA